MKKPTQDIFAEARANLEDVADRISIWQRFLTDERREKFESLNAQVYDRGRYDRFKDFYVEFDADEKTAHATVQAMMVRPCFFRFERDNLFNQTGKTQPLPLSAFLDVSGVTTPTLTVSIKTLPWTVSLSWFSLKHRLRQGNRRGDLWFFPPEHSRIREPVRVEEFDFDEKTKRDVMFVALFEKVEKRAASVTFAKTLRERTAVLRSVRPLQQEETEWHLKG